MASIFTRIIKGEIPCYKVAENDRFLAFLDVMPVREGHVLVVPKVEIDYLFDIEDDLFSEYMLFCKKVAAQMKKVLPCKKIGVTVIGLEVPHAHVHLIPIDRLSDMDFTKEKLSLSKERMDELAELIRG